MQKHKLFELPVAAAVLSDSPHVCTDGSDLLITVRFEDGEASVNGRIRFVKQRAFRKRSEIYCTPWHVIDNFYAVCEIINSEWVAELRVACVPEWRDRWVMRHFMIYLDDIGCTEVIAESVLWEECNDKYSGGT